MDGARNLPPEVSAALGRFRLQADDDRDRAVIQGYLDSGQADPQVSAALQQIVDAMGSGGNQVGAPTSPGSQVLPTNLPQIPFNYAPGRGDIRSQAASQAAPVNLPTPPPPNIQIPSSPNDPMMTGDNPGALATTPGVASVRGLPPTLPSLTPHPVSPMPTGGYGASNMAARAARQDARGQARGPSGAGQTDWRGIESMGANSAFANVDPSYVSTVAGSPGLAAAMMTDQGLPAGRHAPNTAAARTPMMGSALAMAQEGMLGGTKGHGLGVGRPLGADSLQRAEALMNSLGPGESIDPAYVYSKGLRMARKTPLDEMGDPGTQIQVTQLAILKPLKGIVDDQAYTATATMLDRAANAWLQGVADGTINPDLVSYPEYLRQQKKQHYLGR